jgi:uncharacterized protein YdeI (YjbR/CyaY-like superfamily)
MEPEVLYFPDRDGLRRWFEQHHSGAREVWVGFWKAHVPASGLKYLEAVEEALCFGWIDTTVRRVDEDRYAHRFTPRRDGSRWSDSNLARFRALRRAGRVAPAGRSAYQRRERADPRRYSHEGGARPLSPELVAKFRSYAKAWAHFESEPPSYRRLAAHWVMSAVRDETRDRRLTELIDASGRGSRPRAFLVERAARESTG